MSAYTGDIVKDGLTLYLDAANYKSFVSGSTTWYDLARPGFTGSLINGPAYTGSNKGAIIFDGSNDYVNLPSSSLASSSQMTFALWNFGNSLAGTTSVIYFMNSSGTRTLNVHLPWGNVIYFDAGNGSGNTGGAFDRTSKSATTAEFLGWQYWVFTKNATAGTMRIYLNGELWHSAGGANAPIGASVTGSLGSGGPTVGYYYNGRIGMAKLYSRELSAAEIRENYNATKGRYDTTRSSDAIKPRLSTSNIVLHLDAANYRSYVSGSSTWRDMSGRNNNATLASSTNRPTYLNVNAGVISFDGADDYCFITANSDFAYGTNSFTIEAFIYATTLAQTGTYDGHIIYSQTISGTNYLVFDINSTGTIGWISTASGGGTRLSSAAGAVKSQTWHHVVASRIGTNLKLYVDGVSVAEQTNTFDFSNTTYNPTIGNYTHTYGQLPFSGYIPIVRVYKGVGLTANEVIQNRNILKSRFNLP